MCAAHAECVGDADCGEGEVCGQDNGGRFGIPGSADVCWPAVCASAPDDPANCGDAGAPCGACAEHLCTQHDRFGRWATRQGGWPAQQHWVAGDFDGDGRPDLAMAFEQGNRISIDVHTNQDGSFAIERWATRQGGWPAHRQWLSGDFDGDGRVDLAMAFEDGEHVSIDVYLNQGDHFVFQRWATKQGGWPARGQWLSDDFDGDGRLDLALAFEDGDDLSIDVHPNRGGSFGIERWATKQGGWPARGQWVAADFNRDGRSDLALAFDDHDFISIDVHTNQGGTFALERWVTREGGWPHRPRWLGGDFDGDGAADLALAFEHDDYLSIDLRANRQGSFGLERWATYHGGAPSAFDWLAGDFGGDGVPDLALVFEDDDFISIDVHELGSFQGSCAPTAARYQGLILDESEMGDVESEETQGLAESDTHWYWTHVGGITRVRAGGSILSPVEGKAGIPSAFKALGYDHFGDPDFHDERLFVPLTGSGMPKVLLVYDRELALVGWGTLDDGGGAWVSINPVNGLLYASGPYRTVRVYDPTRLKSPADDPRVDGQLASAGLDYLGEIHLELKNDMPEHCPEKIVFPLMADYCASWWDAIYNQGGDISDNGIFYYVLDHNWANYDGTDYTGAHLFDLSSARPSLEASTAPIVEETWPGGGYLYIGYDAQISPPGLGDVSRGDELEGITVYRGENGLTHVLIVMLSNELDDDDVSLFWFSTNEP